VEPELHLPTDSAARAEDALPGGHRVGQRPLGRQRILGRGVRGLSHQLRLCGHRRRDRGCRGAAATGVARAGHVRVRAGERGGQKESVIFFNVEEFVAVIISLGWLIKVYHCKIINYFILFGRTWFSHENLP